MKLNFYLILVVMALFSCKREPAPSVSGANTILLKIDPKNCQNLNTRELFDTILYIPLNKEKGAYLGGINKVILHNNRIYTYGKRNIVCFDCMGNILFKINSMGKGPGEFLQIKDIEVNPYTNKLQVLDRSLKKIICYDLESGIYKNEIDMPYMANNLLTIDGNYTYIYTMGLDAIIGKDELNYHLLKTDRLKNNSLMSKYFENKLKKPVWYNTSPFKKTSDSTALFSYPYSDTIFSIDKHFVSSKFAIDFGKFGLPMKVRMEDEVENSIKNRFAYLTQTYGECDKWLYFEFVFNGNRKRVFYNKVTEKLSLSNYVLYNDFNGLPMGLTLGFENNTLISVVSSLELLRFLRNDGRINADVKNKFEFLNKSDNPVLVFSIMK